MEYYCPPCETAMCQECTSGEHGEHPTVPLKDVVEQHKASLQDQLDAVKKRYSSNTDGTEQEAAFLLPTAKENDPPRSSLLPVFGLLSALSAAPRLPEIDSALQTLSEILQQLTNQKSAIEGDIHTTFDELQKTLNVRKSVLLMELEVNYGLKQKVKSLRLSSLD